MASYLLLPCALGRELDILVGSAEKSLRLFGVGQVGKGPCLGVRTLEGLDFGLAPLYDLLYLWLIP